MIIHMCGVQMFMSTLGRTDSWSVQTYSGQPHVWVQMSMPTLREIARVWNFELGNIFWYDGQAHEWVQMTMSTFRAFFRACKHFDGSHMCGFNVHADVLRAFWRVQTILGS